MSEYKFYVYCNSCIYYKSMNEAIQALKDIEGDDYVALGVTKDGLYSCDLIIGESGNYRISQDYIKSDNFKNDNMITINAITIIKSALLIV